MSISIKHAWLELAAFLLVILLIVCAVLLWEHNPSTHLLAGGLPESHVLVV